MDAAPTPGEAVAIDEPPIDDASTRSSGDTVELADSADLGRPETSRYHRALLVMCSLGAAAIHFGFAPVHLGENALHGWFFLVVAWLQVLWAMAVGWRPSRAVYRLGVLLNAAVIGVWVMSRTAGISGEVEPVGFPDTVAVVLQAIIVIGAVLAIGSLGPLARVLPSWRLGDLSSGAVLGGAAVAIATVVSVSMLPSLSGHDAAGGHTHGDSTETAAGTDHHGNAVQTATGATTDGAAAADGHDHTAAAVAVPYDPDLPIDLGGVPGVTPQQQAEAENIVSATLLGLPQWSDSSVAEAKGFRTIGDGRTGTEHLVNQAFMDDDVILDPNQPESLVYDTTGGGRRLVAAMYMVKRGTPLADVPKLGGALMQWHTHQNLCYNAQGKVAGITNAQGNCPAGLVKPEETPMIHVWIEKNPCGPFAALEGIGAGAIAQGEQRLCDTAHGA